jgi:sporulation protein YlmC with PRC-barrel domain
MRSMRLELGSPAVCSDGQFGELADVVIDPSTRRVTHLVVEPHHRHWLARLVAIELVSPASDERSVMLACTIAQARQLERAQVSAFLPIGGELDVDDPDWDVGNEGVLMQPYYGSDVWTHDAVMAATYDRVPKGEVEIRRASTVTSADEHSVGHVDGFVVDGEQHITHLVLERGHLWGKREITIPINDVSAVQPDAITLRLSKDEVGALEPISVRRRH